MEEEEEKLVDLLASKMKVVASSKEEIYRLLKDKGQYYPPPKNMASTDFISDIMSGEKKVLKLRNISIISISYGKDISIAKILEFARTKCPIDKYLPDLKKDCLPPREYVCNIIHTLIPKEFEDWIEKKIETREEAFIGKKELKMTVLPEFKKLFDSAGTISSMILFLLLTIRVKWKAQ